MIRFARNAAAAALATFAGACASAGQGSDPAALAGCYYFEQDDLARQLQLPWGIRLLDRPLDGWPAVQQYDDVRVATTLTGQDEVDHPFGYWRPLSGDSILVGYPAGGGLSLRLVPDGGWMVGAVRALGDATLQAQRPDHPLRLLHARCPEEL
ncbi:MAG: hypothetical protein KY466_01320 [Gemmatimonadetes bacterium]|nr:hypothetical protein [Gemmatimonadota bacterium]